MSRDLGEGKEGGRREEGQRVRRRKREEEEGGRREDVMGMHGEEAGRRDVKETRLCHSQYVGHKPAFNLVLATINTFSMLPYSFT